jgi:hypothetical protein
MKYARPDYNRIQDPANLIPENEPVFLIRAQDITAPKVVRYWAVQAEREGAKKDIIRAAQKWASRMEKWQRDHMKKIPDMPKKSEMKEEVNGL